jgi:hypothetical protein
MAAAPSNIVRIPWNAPIEPRAAAASHAPLMTVAAANVANPRTDTTVVPEQGLDRMRTYCVPAPWSSTAKHSRGAQGPILTLRSHRS